MFAKGHGSTGIAYLCFLIGLQLMVLSRSVSTHERLHLKSRQNIPHESDHLWHIEKGLVRTFTWDEEGDVVTLGLWGTGDYISQHLSDIRPLQIECLCPVDILAVPASGQDLGMVMRSHIRYMEELFSISSYKRASQRLLRFLDWLGNRFGQQVERGRLIDLGLTHQLLAEITGINRITATRLLNEFEREGKVRQLPKQKIVLQCSFTGVNRGVL